MCRLLGFATRVPTTLADLLGEDDLAGFTELSCKHGDGWGGARATDAAVEVEKAPDAARASPAFRAWAHECLADLALVHLRWATLGLPVVSENAHPFSDGQHAYAHNGSVPPPESLDPLVDPRLLAGMRGTTDSERLFLAVLSRLDPSHEDPVGDALAQAVRDVVAHCRPGSLNSMLLTRDRLYALTAYSAEAERKEPDPEYYALRVRTSTDAVVVSSSGWGSGWYDLPNGTMLVVDRHTLETTERSLGLPEAGTW